VEATTVRIRTPRNSSTMVWSGAMIAALGTCARTAARSVTPKSGISAMGVACTGTQAATSGASGERRTSASVRILGAVAWSESQKSRNWSGTKSSASIARRMRGAASRAAATRASCSARLGSSRSSGTNDVTAPAARARSSSGGRLADRGEQRFVALGGDHGEAAPLRAQPRSHGAVIHDVGSRVADQHVHVVGELGGANPGDGGDHRQPERDPPPAPAPPPPRHAHQERQHAAVDDAERARRPVRHRHP